MASISARRGLIVLSAATVATVATAGLAVPVIADEATAPKLTCTTTTTGSTNWNIKESFNNYLEGPIANGNYKYKGGVDTRDGIQTDGSRTSRTFDWPVASANVETGTISHNGAVHYTGHNHYQGDDATQAPDNFILDNDFSNLTVEITGDTTGRILVDYQSREFIDTNTVGAFSSGTQAELASITFDDAVDLTADGAITATGTTVLTNNGATVFGGFYDAGTELSAITLNLTNTTDCVELPPVEDAPGEDNEHNADSANGSSDGGPLGILALLAALGGIGAAVFGWLTTTGLLKF